MPKLTRYLQKIFANNSNEVGVFGTGVDKETSKNVETLQSADYENGWSSAIITNKNYPIWQEMDGVQYGLSYQLKYLFQNGMPEWLSTETYYTNSYCRVGSNIYYSLQDNNINHNPALDDGYWTPLLTSNRSIGEIIPSCVPLTEAGLHLLDGALITNGMYADFVTYMANLTATAPEVFTTEADWQSAVATYGVCSKFVYDSVNNTVRLPKWGNQAFTKNNISTATTLPVKGNGKSLGLTDGTTNCGLEGVVNLGAALASGAYNQTVGTSAGSDWIVSQKAIGVVTDSTKSGIVTDISSFTNQYGVDCYYYIVIATSTKTDIEVDIDEIATDLNGKADVDLTNINASCKPLDGQWVASQLSIATGTSLPTTGNIEYDLSTYLPSDNYKYDVLFHIIVTTGSTGNSNAYGVISSDIIDSPVYVCGTRNPSANTVAVTNAGSVILPVAANRKLYVVRVSSNTGTFTLMAHGYRRIGTNS